MLRLFRIFEASVGKEYFMIKIFTTTALETLQLPTYSTTLMSKMQFYMLEAGIYLFFNTDWTIEALLSIHKIPL